MASQSPLHAENYHLKWDSHLTNLNLSLTSLFKTERFADVMLLSSHPACLGGPAIPAHKIILSSCSHFFSTIFTNQLAQNSLMYIMLPPELSYRCIKTLVQYMYSGESTVSNDILNEVLRGGEILKIRGLCKSRSRQTSQQRSHTPSGSSGNNQIGKSPLHQSPLTSLPKESPVILKLPIKPAQKIDTLSCALPLSIVEKISIRKDIAIDPENSCNSDSDLLQQPTTYKHCTQNCCCKKCLPPPPSNCNIKEKHLAKGISIEKDSSEQSSVSSRLSGEKQTKNCEPSTSGIATTTTTTKRKITEVNNVDTQSAGSTKNDDITNSKNKNIESEKLDNLLTTTIATEKICIKQEKDFIETIKEEPIDMHHTNSENSRTSSGQLIVKPPPPLVEKIKIERLDEDGAVSDGEQVDDYEIYELDDDDNDDNENENFAPLECEMCNEKFALPRDWVRHIETHMDATTTTDIPKKKQKLEKKATKEDDDYIVALKCDLCATFFDSPADWVRHIENEHTEKELAAVNNKHFSKPIVTKSHDNRSSNKFDDYLSKSCDICGEIFESYAKKIIHYRTHIKVSVRSLLKESPIIHKLQVQKIGASSNALPFSTIAKISIRKDIAIDPPENSRNSDSDLLQQPTIYKN